MFFADVSNTTASGAADEAGFDVPEHMQGLVSAVLTTNAIAVCCSVPSHVTGAMAPSISILLMGWESGATSYQQLMEVGATILYK